MPAAISLPTISSQGAQVFVKGIDVNFVHLVLSVSSASKIRNDVRWTSDLGIVS